MSEHPETRGGFTHAEWSAAFAQTLSRTEARRRADELFGATTQPATGAPFGFFGPEVLVLLQRVSADCAHRVADHLSRLPPAFRGENERRMAEFTSAIERLSPPDEDRDDSRASTEPAGVTSPHTT
jgi:hypothetical protein